MGGLSMQVFFLDKQVCFSQNHFKNSIYGFVIQGIRQPNTFRYKYHLDFFRCKPGSEWAERNNPILPVRD